MILRRGRELHVRKELACVPVLYRHDRKLYRKYRANQPADEYNQVYLAGGLRRQNDPRAMVINSNIESSDIKY